MVTWSGTGADAFWWHLLSLDPNELEKLRRHQIMALGRYGRQQVNAWDDRDVTELTAWYRELSELMKAESAISKTSEDC